MLDVVTVEMKQSFDGVNLSLCTLYIQKLTIFLNLETHTPPYLHIFK